MQRRHSGGGALPGRPADQLAGRFIVRANAGVGQFLRGNVAATLMKLNVGFLVRAMIATAESLDGRRI